MVAFKVSVAVLLCVGSAFAIPAGGKDLTTAAQTQAGVPPRPPNKLGKSSPPAPRHSENEEANRRTRTSLDQNSRRTKGSPLPLERSTPPNRTPVTPRTHPSEDGPPTLCSQEPRDGSTATASTDSTVPGPRFL
uniref:Putative secreted protein n=1 Tax=Ixodes ricinus TaxID=34613 RepID=V5HE26_IXORI